MKDITLHINNNATATCVPNVFIDDLMVNANGEFVKIYLYLLRCMNSSGDFSISKMADKFDHTEKDIKRALSYWEKMHVLQLEYDTNEQLSGICFLDSSSLLCKPELPPAAAPVSLHAAAAPHVENKRTAYSKDELLSFRQDETISDLFFIIERYIGHPLSAAEYENIIYWYDGLHLSTDLIEYLVESCVDKGHKNVRYMDKVAIAWASASIKTVEDAKKASGIHSQTYYGIMKAFGISGRNLAEYETTLVDKWTHTFGFSLDIITEACKRTIQATSQPSFQYADSILTNWHKCNIHHPEDIALLDNAYKKSHAAAPKNSANTAKPIHTSNRFNNFSQRAYNYEQLEQQLLNRSTQ